MEMVFLHLAARMDAVVVHLCCFIRDREQKNSHKFQISLVLKFSQVASIGLILSGAS